MFERFTNTARHVIVLSQEEARLQSHNYIGTEHILLGLLGEPESIAGQVLASFGLTLDGVRGEVVERVGRGKKPPAGHIPFTPRAKKTLELSLREALAIKHKYIGTEHILLGLIREGDGVAAQIMSDHADLLQIRLAVLDAVPASDPDESPESAEETNAVLRWLRQRLTLRGGSAQAVEPGAESETRSTPAVEAALQEAARLAGARPVGSHHLLLAALQDANSAASSALASLGVDMDELREKLRSAKITGTSDEQPEQAGRRQMAIQVSDEMLHIVLTDRVIVEAAKEALRVVNAKAAKAAADVAAAADQGGEPAGEAAAGEASAGEAAVGEATASEAPAGEAGAEGTSATASVIRGDLPGAAGLANVWLELHDTLAVLAGTTPPAARRMRVRVARRLPVAGDPGEPSDPGSSEARTRSGD
jgi:ATP-dependent Clp protease ATP-binding subunit ClpC